ncbi:MAG: cellulase family glycosylhydrolase [Oscillospiraceae bacterium]|nr:cellulase family glycosylhydrolase [Oscillospiraceae bacterium]
MTACGGEKEDPPKEISEVQTTEKVTEISETAEATDADIFGENYDPLDDSYDPYGGGGASTAAAASAVTEKSEEDDESDEPESTKAPSETKPAETKKAAENKTTEKTTTPNVTEAAKTEAVTAAPENKPVQTTANEPVQTTAKKTSEEKASDDVELIIGSANGWNDGTNDFSQIDGTIKNNGKGVVNGWTAKISVGSNATVDQSWNCGIDLKDGVLTVTPVEYNGNIDPGSEATFGMILKNPGKIDADKSELTCSVGTYAATGGNWNNNNNNNNSTGDGTPPPAPVYAKDVPEPTTDDWLSVKGNKIVDKDGREVWLTGINWFGYNTGTNTFDGLWACDLNTSLAAIADHGFNLLRIPISAELVNNWAAGNYPNANFNQATNSYLVGMTSLEIFDYVIGQCRANGIKIMMDIHSAKTDSMGHMKNVWYEGNVTEQDYLDALSWLAARYKNDDTIIAYDLKNEPHGKANETPRAKWDGSKDADNWKYIAEKAANAVLSKNPNVLVMVEGIEIYPRDIKSNGDFSSTNPGDYYSTWWGGNLRGVKDNPVNLGKYQNKLVYSPHDYGPAVYQQEWFKGDYDYNSLKKDAWNDNWLYIHDNGTAPLLIGEWGGYMTQPNLKWMTYLRQLIKEKKLNHTFWCFNANSGDTGGLVKDDFVTWDKEKYEFVKEVLWQEDGKFVGLDHEIPLGSNGKALGK